MGEKKEKLEKNNMKAEKKNVKKSSNGIKARKLWTILGTIILLAIIAVSVVVNQVTKRQGGVITSELAKAMTYDQVEDGDEALDETPNVKFDAFFLRDINNDGYTEGIRGTCKEIGDEDTLYMELNVQTAGYLKDAKITINSDNFYLQTALPEDEEFKSSYIGNNIETIEFKDISNGTQKTITGIVRSGDYSYSNTKTAAIGSNINNYSKVNSVTLTGTYVNGTQEIPISKTVSFNIDWYGTTTAGIYSTLQNKDIEDAIDEENGVVNLDFTIYTQETEQELLLSSNHVEGEIPELNGYAPTEVRYTGSTGVFNYDAETRTFTIDKTAVVDENGNITTSVARSNSYSIRVTYPIEAYQSLGTDTVTLSIPVSTYYEGYNNRSTEFTNPYRSNIAEATIIARYEQPAGTEAEFDVKVGKYVSSPTTRYIVS